MWIQIAQFILSLSILIVFHEGGHFAAAKIFKTRVEKFYLFFNPWFSLFKKKIGETVYGIGWLPLGGYVKISGMIDESMDKDQMEKPPEPWEFRSKPAWQRLIIMLGGVAVNVILGVIIYAMVLFTWGKEYIPTSALHNGIYADSLAQSFGLQNGDRVYAVGNQPVKKFNDIKLRILLDDPETIQVVRNNDSLNIDVPSDIVGSMLDNKDMLVYPGVLTLVDSILPNTPAAESGLKKGDKIIAINGQRTPFFQEAVKYLQKNKNQKTSLTVVRNASDTVQLQEVTSKKDGTLGFAIVNPRDQLPTQKITYSFLGSLPAGVTQGYTTLVNYIRQFKLIVKKPSALGGFGTIAKQYSPTWDWHSFWTFTAFLSIVLAVMNILPIPALDGGHVVFLLYEMISGRRPSQKVLENAQVVGMLILLALLVYANGNDIIRFFN